MPKRNQRQIHAPLKQDIRLYREMQKEKILSRLSDSIPSTSSCVEQSTLSSPLPLTTLPEEVLSELELVSVHKKAKQKTKHLEPSTKKIILDEEINLNLDTPEYLNISEQESCTILNTPEKIFTLVHDEALASEEWELDEDIINMTDGDFEKIIENPNDLENILNAALDENEKEEQQVKETVFQLLLKVEKEIEISSKQDNKNNETPSTSNTNIFKNLCKEELSEEKKHQLRKKRTTQQKEKELLKRLEEDLEKLKEVEGETFPSFLSKQIENEIILKRKKIKKMQRKCFSFKKYRESEKGKETIKKYRESEQRKIIEKIYEQSEKGKETRKRYKKSEQAKEARKRYNDSEKGKELRKKISEMRKQQRLEYKLRAEFDPEFKKILDEKKRIKSEKDKIRYQRKKLENLLLNNN